MCDAKRLRQQERQSTSLFSKNNNNNNFARAGHVLYISLPLLLQREASQLDFLGRKCVVCAYTHTKKTAACVPVHVSFFSFSLSSFYCRSFSRCWPLAFLIFSPPLQNFNVFLPTKFVSFVFHLQLQLSVRLLLPTFSFSLPFSIFQICENGKLSKLNTLDNTYTATISAFLFVRLQSAIDSCFKRREWPSDFPPNKPRVAVG